jgi:hypothetical protein
MPYTLTVNGNPRTVDVPGKRVRALPLAKTDLRPA